MTNYQIKFLLDLIEETDAERKRYNWKKTYTLAHAPVQNIEAREIRRLGSALQNIVNRNNLHTVRGY